MRLTSLIAVTLACPLLMMGSQVNAQAFEGRTITMVVNYSPGGPTDIEARLVAHHLGKHLPGIKSIVVQNSGGAGGAIGVNQIGQSSGNEAFNIGFFTWDPVDQLIQSEALRVSYNDLKFVAGFRQASLAYIRHDTAPGLKQPRDIARATPFRAGALSPSNHLTVRQSLALDLLGSQYETIAGYRGLRDIEIAIQRNDLQLASNSAPGWYGTIKPILADTGIVMPLFQYDYKHDDGTLGRNPGLPDIPAFIELYRELHGKQSPPSGPSWQMLQLLNEIMNNMYRTVFMPPSAPDQAVAEMREAFERLAKDTDFITAYAAMVKTSPQILVGEPGQKIIANLGQVDQSMLTFLREYIDKKR